MEPSALIRRTGLGLAGSAIAMTMIVVAAHADEVASGAAPPSNAAGVVIHDADATLRDHCRFEDGALWLCLPGGARFELVTSTADPSIANPGDGGFHPFDAAEVRAAIEAVRYPTAALACEIWLLPYPRRQALESAAAPGLVLLSPAVLPIPRERQHAEVVHELGHVVQYARMPDADLESWDRYRGLRGITDAGRFFSAAAHADRPHEIFAEDFRALFGGALATISGSIENATLAPPATVPSLETFLFALAGGTPASASFAAWPNPSAGVVRVAFAGTAPGASSDLDVFDAGGRRVTTIAAVTAAGVSAWEWDGRGAGGERVAPGTYYALARGGWCAVKIVRVR